MKINLFPIFLSGYPCRYRCGYCNAAGSSGVTTTLNWASLTADLESWTAGYHENREIAIYGNDLSALPHQIIERLLSLCQGYVKSGKIKGIRISVRPDTVNSMSDNELRMFSTVELGVPSLDQRVLNRINRGHSTETVLQASKRLKTLMIAFGFQTMIGLPGFSVRSDLTTARTLASLKPNFVRIHPALVLKNTDLHDMMNRGEYQPLDLEQAVAITAKVTEIYLRSGIHIARCGFHLPENVRSDVLIAGPWHPAFGQLVGGRRWRKRLYRELLKDPEKRTIFVNQVDLSDAIGHKRANLEWLNRTLDREINIVSIK